MREISDIDLREVIENELNDRFNNKGFICCPFHLDNKPSLSIKFFPDKNKYRYKCFACGESGDAIDFMMNKRNVDYKTARELLGMENEKTTRELQEDRVKEFINRIKPKELLKGLFTFVDANNEPIYFKAKLVNEDGSKYAPYFSISGNEVIAKRLHEEVPYNLFNLLNGIRNGKTIIFVEGEKDANTINKVLRGKNYVATSIKGCKDLELIKSQQIKAVYVIGDTGEAGEKYVKLIKSEFQDISDVFKIIKLPDLRALGNNKDVTDWFEAGHTLEELFSAFNRVSNINNKLDFYENLGGTYKDTIKITSKGEELNTNKITNFSILDGKILNYIEDEKEGVKLKMKSANNKVIEREGFSTAFDDTKSFKAFLESMELTFYGNTNVLNDYKTWVNNNYLFDTENVYTGDRFIELNGQLSFVTKLGALSKSGVDKTTYAGDGKINILDIKPIESEALVKLKEALLNYLSIDKTIAILGTIVNNLAVYQAMQHLKLFHFMLLVGESGSGKSTILEHIIAPFLNYPREKNNKKTMASSQFAMQKDLCTGNYTALYDEYKPSMMSERKWKELSNIFRNLYDRGVMEKGTKNQKVNQYEYHRSLIIAGEETFPYGENALKLRSCIVYISKAERTQKNTEAMKYLMAHTGDLNSLGKSMIDIVLDISTEKYGEMHNAALERFEDIVDKPKDTAANISVGIELFNSLLIKHGIAPIENYEDEIRKILKAEILDDGEDSHSIVEQMLLQFDDMVGVGRIPFIENLMRYENGYLYIHSGELIARLLEYTKSSNAADIMPLKARDFRKQAKLARYIVQDDSELRNVKADDKAPAYAKGFTVDGKTIKMDRYDIEKLMKLGIVNLVNIDGFSPKVESKDNNKLIPIADWK